MTERLLVVGGDAAGMSAASQARRRRRRDDLEIVAYERSNWVSYSACGEPYHIAGDIEPIERLVARTPEQFGEMDIEVHTGHEVVELDLDRRRAEVLDRHTGRTFATGFDQVVVATGAKAARGNIAGSHLHGVWELRTLDQASALRDVAAARSGNAVIVGGGYIGLESAEAFWRRGWNVTVLTSGDSVLERTVDADLGDWVVESMAREGIRVDTGVRVRCINGTEHVVSVGCDHETIPADVVVLGLGSVPEVELAEEAGIPLGQTGAIAVDDRQRTTIEGVWSAGDCAEVRHRVSGRKVNIHLGTVANKTGRVAGINIGGGDARFPGALGTSITKVCDTEIAATGLKREAAEAAGFDAVEGSASGTTAAGYWPSTADMRIRVVAERGSTRILGAQVVGGPGAGKRIDTFATALWAEMSASELAWADLAYAPPFSGVWDLVHIAARRAAEAARA